VRGGEFVLSHMASHRLLRDVALNFPAMRRAGQLAEFVLSVVEGLKQGPPEDESIPPLGQPAGVGRKKTSLFVRGL